MLDQTSQQPHLAALPPVSSVCAESPSLQRCWTLSYPNLQVLRSPLCHSQNQTAAHPIRRRCLPDTGRQRRLFFSVIERLRKRCSHNFCVEQKTPCEWGIKKENRISSVLLSLIPTLDITFQLNILPIEKKKTMKFRSQVSTISFPCLNSSILG